MEQLNALENYYFNRLKEIFEKMGHHLLKTLHRNIYLTGLKTHTQENQVLQM